MTVRPYHIHQRLDKVALPEQHIAPHRVAVLCEVELVEEDVDQTAVNVRGGLLDKPLQSLDLNEGGSITVGQAGGVITSLTP